MDYFRSYFYFIWIAMKILFYSWVLCLFGHSNNPKHIYVYGIFYVGWTCNFPNEAENFRFDSHESVYLSEEMNVCGIVGFKWNHYNCLKEFSLIASRENDAGRSLGHKVQGWALSEFHTCVPSRNLRKFQIFPISKSLEQQGFLIQKLKS